MLAETAIIMNNMEYLTTFILLWILLGGSYALIFSRPLILITISWAHPMGQAQPQSARPIKMHTISIIHIIKKIIRNGQYSVSERCSVPAVQSGTPSPPSPNHGNSQNFGNRSIGSTGEIHKEPITVKFNNKMRAIWENNLTYLIRFRGLESCLEVVSVAGFGFIVSIALALELGLELSFWPGFWPGSTGLALFCLRLLSLSVLTLIWLLAACVWAPPVLEPTMFFCAGPLSLKLLARRLASSLF